MQDAHPQQIQLSPAIHLSFNQLQAVDLPFGLAITPRQAECGYHRRFVNQDTADKTDQLDQPATQYGGDPGIQVLGAVLTGQCDKGIA